MKICAIICEYNPFHNGHLYQLQQAKSSGCDAVICIMSGNFVQRGEAAIINKYARAQHAVKAGADIVIELPTIFATANAELFAQGAIKLLSEIPAVSQLCFGAERADKQAFLTAAQLLLNEPKEISDAIKNALSLGNSYAKARADAWQAHIPLDLLSNPNNILGLEYTKAILANRANIDILPIQRIGSGYLDKELANDFSSASAIRECIKNGKSLNETLPAYVKENLPTKLQDVLLDVLEKYALLTYSAEKIAKICDCSEGLENAFKKAALKNTPLTETLTSARYTASRIRRIALHSLLNIEECFIRNALQSPLYLRVLAANKARNDVLSSLSEADIPVICRAHDEDALQGIAKVCYEKDIYAENVYTLLYPQKEKTNIFI